mgnify:CR=1 FL=1
MPPQPSQKSGTYILLFEVDPDDFNSLVASFKQYKVLFTARRESWTWPSLDNVVIVLSRKISDTALAFKTNLQYDCWLGDDPGLLSFLNPDSPPNKDPGLPDLHKQYLIERRDYRINAYSRKK